MKYATKKPMVTITRAPRNALCNWKKGNQDIFLNVHQFDQITQVFHLLLFSSLSFHLKSPSFTASLATLDILWPIGRLRT